jgi:hypothetical protein
MKWIFSVLFIFLFLLANFSSANAEEIELTQKKMSIEKNLVTLIRTEKTPLKVKLDVAIPMEFTKCEEYEVQTVFGRNGVCGYDTHWEYGCRDVCTSYRTCSPGSMSDNCGCQNYSNRCDNYPTQVMRSCYYPASVCVRTGTEIRTSRRNVTFNFKHARELVGSELEKYDLKVTQIFKDEYFVRVEAQSDQADYKLKESQWFNGYFIKVKQ